MSKSSTIANEQNTTEIRPADWILFLTEFTRENRGTHARLDILGPNAEAGYQVETEDRPLDGVSADIKDRERTVWIAFGSTGEDHLTHGVHNATVIRALARTQVRGAVLEVESADGTKTILQLSQPEQYELPRGSQR